jgi:hypothetical protein
VKDLVISRRPSLFHNGEEDLQSQRL